MSPLKDLKKQLAVKAIGIDCSTKSLGFAIVEDGKLIDFGEIPFDGSDVFERLKDAKLQTIKWREDNNFSADYIAIESAIMVANIQVAIKLAYIYGAVIAELQTSGAKVVTVPPITWQTFIGNPNLKKYEKEQIKLDNPGKSASWYQNHGRSIRKARTLAFANKLHSKDPITSDNIGDAVGVAYWAVSQTLHKESA